MSFADLESRTNAAVMRRLANATASTVAGAEFQVIFDRAYLAALGGEITAAQPQADALDADLSANDVEVGTSLTIKDIDYTVRDLHPDGTGMTTMILETA